VTGAALLTALLLSAPGPAAAPPGPPPPVDQAGQRIEIDVRFPPWQFTGTFTLTVDGRRDQGVARDHGSVVKLKQPVERVLEGQLGTITLELITELRGALVYPPIFGRWKVVEATGAWAGLRGGGTFSAVDAGASASGGSPFERQTLLGRVTPRR
jgi:hypothetical protein